MILNDHFSADAFFDLLYATQFLSASPFKGLPENLHGDRGSVQESNLVKTIHEYIMRAMEYGLLKTRNNSLAYHPFLNPHQENVFKTFKNDFLVNYLDAKYPYCKAAMDENTGKPLTPPRDKWHLLPTVEDAQSLLEEWLRWYNSELIHSTYEVTRCERYNMAIAEMLMDNPNDPRFQTPDRSYFAKLLLHKAEAKLHESGYIKFQGLTYRADALKEYAQNHGKSCVQVWWNRNDLRWAIIFGPDGQEICKARADGAYFVDDPLSAKKLALMKKESRQYRKRQRALKEEAIKRAESGDTEFVRGINDAARRAVLLQRPPLQLVDGGNAGASQGGAAATPQQEETLPSEQPGIIRAMQILKGR